MPKTELDLKTRPAGCISFLAPFLVFPGLGLWLAWEHGIALQTIAFLAGLVCAVISLVLWYRISESRSKKDSAEENWASALLAAEMGASSAADLFASAIRKDPWKYCGVGEGAYLPPDRHVRMWLEGMRRAGYSELTDYLQHEPAGGDSLDELAMREARRRLVLSRICERATATQHTALEPDDVNEEERTKESIAQVQKHLEEAEKRGEPAQVADLRFQLRRLERKLGRR